MIMLNNFLTKNLTFDLNAPLYRAKQDLKVFQDSIQRIFYVTPILLGVIKGQNLDYVINELALCCYNLALYKLFCFTFRY